MGGLEGLVLLAAGREADVFVRPDGLLVKLMRSPDFATRVDREAAALTTLAGMGHLAPRLEAAVNLDGRPGLVIERIEGLDLLTLLTRRPWRFVRAATAMANLHAGIHEVMAPTSFPDLKAELRVRIETTAALSAHLATYAVEILETLPAGDRLCHGDLHPGNVLGTWVAPVAIDWSDASRGVPAADVARTEVLVRFGEPIEPMSTPVRTLMSTGRGLMAERYLSVYRRSSAADLSHLADWIVVRAAARFYEGIEAEYEVLAHVIDRHRRRRGHG
jgi:aminoglycoside phosphotransferase (APT) family kinase protein